MPTIAHPTMGGRCNGSGEPLLLAGIHPLGLPACPAWKVDSHVWQSLVLQRVERRDLILHDELVCKPTEKDCGLGVAVASCPTRQLMCPDECLIRLHFLRESNDL